jgi:hypothetical protein
MVPRLLNCQPFRLALDALQDGVAILDLSQSLRTIRYIEMLEQQKYHFLWITECYY